MKNQTSNTSIHLLPSSHVQAFAKQGFNIDEKGILLNCKLQKDTTSIDIPYGITEISEEKF